MNTIFRSSSSLRKLEKYIASQFSCGKFWQIIFYLIKRKFGYFNRNQDQRTVTENKYATPYGFIFVFRSHYLLTLMKKEIAQFHLEIHCSYSASNLREKSNMNKNRNLLYNSYIHSPCKIKTHELATTENKTNHKQSTNQKSPRLPCIYTPSAKSTLAYINVFRNTIRTCNFRLLRIILGEYPDVISRR